MIPVMLTYKPRCVEALAILCIVQRSSVGLLMTLMKALLTALLMNDVAFTSMKFLCSHPCLTRKYGVIDWLH